MIHRCLIRDWAVVAWAALLVGSAPAQMVFSFEGSVAGAVLGPSPDAEGWISDGGTAAVAPSGFLLPINGFPSSGSQWCVVGSAGASGLGTGGVVAPGGPANFPLSPGSVGNARLPVTLPPNPGGPVTLEFDFTFVTPECASDILYNDWCSVDLLDPVTGLSLQNLLYRDTFSTALVPGATSPGVLGQVTNGPCSSPLEEGPIGVVHTVSVPVNPALLGSTVVFQVAVGDGFDTAFNSWCYLDNLTITGGLAPLSSALVTDPSGGFLFTVSAPRAAVAGPYELLTLASAIPAVPTGAGPIFGLNLDPLLLDTAQSPLGTAPFHLILPGTQYTYGPFVAPSGLTVDWVTLALGVSGGAFGILEQTPAGTFTF